MTSNSQTHRHRISCQRIFGKDTKPYPVQSLFGGRKLHLGTMTPAPKTPGPTFRPQRLRLVLILLLAYLLSVFEIAHSRIGNCANFSVSTTQTVENRSSTR